MPTVRSGSANAGTNQISAIAVTLPTGWQAGDVVMFGLMIRNTTTGGTWTETQGFAEDANGTNSGDTIGQQWATFSKVMAGGESNPTFTYTDTGRWCWAGVCVRPNSGGVLTINAGPVQTITTGSASANLPSPSLAAAGGATGLTSVLFSVAVAASVNTAAGITQTAPTNWAIPSGGQATTASGTTNANRQVSAAGATRDSQSGTVSPGAWTLTQTGVSAWRGTVSHYLIQETVAADPVRPPRRPGPNYRR